MLHRAHQHSHGDGKQCGQQSTQDQNGPPRDRQAQISPQQDTEKFPVIAAADLVESMRHLPEPRTEGALPA